VDAIGIDQATAYRLTSPLSFGLVQVEPGDVLQYRVHLRQHLLTLFGEPPHLALELPVLVAEPPEGVDGAADRFLYLCHTLDDRIAHQALLPIRRFSA